MFSPKKIIICYILIILSFSVNAGWLDDITNAASQAIDSATNTASQAIDSAIDYGVDRIIDNVDESADDESREIAKNALRRSKNNNFYFH